MNLNWFLTLVLAVVFVSPVCAQQKKKKQKKQKNINVQEVVEDYFKTVPNYISGDLITNQQIEPLIRLFDEAGWKIQNTELLLRRFIKTGSYLDQVMNSSPKGRVFFRQITSFKNGMDRVERMSVMKAGKSTIRQLVYEMPGGADYVKALATTKHGQKLGHIVRQSKNGQNFNKPTGKLYNEEQLIEHLEKLYKERPKQSKFRENQFAR